MEKHFFSEDLSAHENNHVFDTDSFVRPGGKARE
jgi:hypothetical protein